MCVNLRDLQMESFSKKIYSRRGAKTQGEERLGGDTSPSRVRGISDFVAIRSREIGCCG